MHASPRRGPAPPVAPPCSRRGPALGILGRRERKAARELDADFDKLTVSARSAVETARKLSSAEMLNLIDAAVQRAKARGPGGEPGG